MATPLSIDTTPPSPKPPDRIVQAAAEAIPQILGNVAPDSSGGMAMVGAILVKRLQGFGHTFAAAQWAIHTLVQRGMLAPETITIELPSVGVWRGSRIPRLYGGTPSGHLEWHGGGTGTVPVPQDKPAPFDSFQVAATAVLWDWWKDIDESRSTSQRDEEQIVNSLLQPSREGLPHSVHTAHHRLAEVLATAIEQFDRNVRFADKDAVLRAIERFVDEIRRVPSWRTELERRVSLVERGCAAGGLYDLARLKALRSYRGRPKKLLRAKLAIERLRGNATQHPLFLAEVIQTRDAIEAVLDDQTLGLSPAAIECFGSWRDECRTVHREAERLEVDGCWYLLQAYLASGPSPSERAQTARALLKSDMGGVHLDDMLAAANSLAAWLVEQPSVGGDSAKPTVRQADPGSGRLTVDEVKFSITWLNQAPVEIGNRKEFHLLQALAAAPDQYHAFADLAQRLGGDQLDQISHVKSRLIKLLRESGLSDLAGRIRTQKGHYGLFVS